MATDGIWNCCGTPVLTGCRAGASDIGVTHESGAARRRIPDSAFPAALPEEIRAPAARPRPGNKTGRQLPRACVHSDCKTPTTTGVISCRWPGRCECRGGSGAFMGAACIYIFSAAEEVRKADRQALRRANGRW